MIFDVVMRLLLRRREPVLSAPEDHARLLLMSALDNLTDGFPQTALEDAEEAADEIRRLIAQAERGEE